MGRPENLSDLLADAGLRLKRQTPGHSETHRCPRCNGGATRELSLSVTVDADGDGAAWQCHRGSCGWKGGGRVGSGRGPQRERPIRPPAPHTVEQQSSRPDWLYRFFAERRIGARTVHDLGIYAVERGFPEPVGRASAIVFPYRYRSEVVNRKYRPYPAKNPMQQEPDALPTLFNIDALGEAPDQVVFVEGETDVAAMWECGVRHAVTLKDGAPQSAKYNPDDQRFAALRTHADVLGKARCVVLAGDVDGPGLALREELARRIGRHRCRIVDWPAGCKDACDTLRQHGPETLVAAVAEAAPYPIEGLRSTYGGRLVALRELPPPQTMSTGAASTDGILNLPTEGRLIVVTGWPSSGKSCWTRFVMIHTAKQHGRRWCVFSPEMQPWEEFVASCAEVVIGKPFWPASSRERMSVQETIEAEAWLTNRVVMMVCDAEDQTPTLDWIIQHARMAVLRDGVTDLLIDPWNEVEHDRPRDVTETEYIGRSLQRLKAFGGRHGCNVWIVAHPAKPLPIRSGEKRAAPGPYDISSSAHWHNRADVGLTVHSEVKNRAQIALWKARFRRWGVRGESADLAYDDMTGQYSTVVYP